MSYVEFMISDIYIYIIQFTSFTPVLILNFVQIFTDHIFYRLYILAGAYISMSDYISYIIVTRVTHCTFIAVHILQHKVQVKYSHPHCFILVQLCDNVPI